MTSIARRHNVRHVRSAHDRGDFARFVPCRVARRNDCRDDDRHGRQRPEMHDGFDDFADRRTDRCSEGKQHGDQTRSSRTRHCRLRGDAHDVAVRNAHTCAPSALFRADVPRAVACIAVIDCQKRFPRRMPCERYARTRRRSQPNASRVTGFSVCIPSPRNTSVRRDGKVSVSYPQTGSRRSSAPRRAPP